jgi:cell division protein FtsB
VGALFLYLLLLSDFGLLRQWKLGREAAEIRARIERLEAREIELESQRGQLDSDTALERIAREEYGMVKTGEHVYRIAGPDSTGNNR